MGFRGRASAFVAASCAIVLAACGAVDGTPRFTGPVVDAAGVLSGDLEGSLGAELEQFRVEQGPQIAVLTVESTNGSSIEDYAIDVAREWGVGDRVRDDGVLLVIVMGSRELRIEVGSGVEDELTDVESGRIIDMVIVPKLRDDDLDGAVRDGVEALRTELSGGSYAIPDEESPGGEAEGSLAGSAAAVAVFVLFALMVVAFMVFLARRPGRGTGGSRGSWSSSTHSSSSSDDGFSGGSGGGFSGGGASGKW